MQLCPKLIAQHVATWREGDDKWAYRTDAAANIATDKVSLDPYRLQSRRILALIKESLPRKLQKIEKASIDEVFLDLSAHIHFIMLERFPELAFPPPYDDPLETLPLPPVAALDWQADTLVQLDEEQEALDPDWDDVAMLVGSEIVRNIRTKVREELGYTCSAGVANNKLLSKLGSAFQKPNRQTVVRNRAVQPFLAAFKATKIRNLGGKLGEQVVSTFCTDEVRDLLELSVGQMTAKLGDETGLWLYNTIRGIDTSEVNPRTQIKSMLSAKSFRPAINSADQGVKWLRIFVADIYSRLIEEGVLDNKRWPRTINLHHRHAGQTRSRQVPIPQGKSLDEELLFHLAHGLLKQIMADGSIWPCANLSLSVGGFGDGVKGNIGIDAFVVKGQEAESLRSFAADSRPANGASGLPARPDAPTKRRRAGEGGMHRFLAKKSHDVASQGEQDKRTRIAQSVDPQAAKAEDTKKTGDSSHIGDHQTVTGDYTCHRCEAGFDSQTTLQGHLDWHFAKDLQQQESATVACAEKGPALAVQPTRRGRPRSAKRNVDGKKMEHGQSRLKFG